MQSIYRSLFIAFISMMTCSFLHTSQVVLITGASRGIGLSIASLLAREGYIVYAGIRNSSSIEEALAIQENYPERFHLIELDVINQKSVDQAIQIIQEQQNRLDVLINNAGILIYGSIENHTIEEAQHLFDVNFFGAMRVTQAVLPLMRHQQKGKIIQISSRSGFRPLPSISLYAASKFALEGLSETMAATLKPWNIDVSLIEPGPVDTDLDYLAHYGARLPRDQDPYYAIFHDAGLLQPMGSMAQKPIEIAQLVKEVIETDHPLFRYQTTETIKKQAARRLFDPTGLTSIREWHDFLFPSR